MGVPPILVSPPECLFGRFQLDFGFWLNMLLRGLLWVEAQIQYPLCFGRVTRSQVVEYIFIGTSRNLNSYNCRSLIYQYMRVWMEGGGSGIQYSLKI